MRKQPRFSMKMSKSEEIASNYSVIIAVLPENNEKDARTTLHHPSACGLAMLFAIPGKRATYASPLDFEGKKLMSLEVSELTHSWGLRGVSFEVPSPSVTILLGPSGCGKSTLLRCLAGFETPCGGTIQFDGRDWLRLSPRERAIGYAPQQMALTPHWTVRELLAYAIAQENLKSAEVAARITSLLELTELTPLADQLCRELSGGEQRRVGLARALIRHSPVVLLDEPLSELDRPLRDRLLTKLKAWFQQHPALVLWVTHDRADAEQFAIKGTAQVLVMGDGMIQQAGSLAELRSGPRTDLVREFVGSS
jgi:putative spermidine/putrescine transport system ATP-binding protein